MNQKQIVGWVLAIAAINWGLTALGMNVVEMIFGGLGISNIVYLAIGAVGLYKVYLLTMGGKKK